MTEYTHLWLYFLMVFGVIALPGMDMAFVLASALSGGRRAGAFAVAGIVFGGLCHTAAGALGVGLIFKLMPALVNIMLVVGSLYIAWIGIALLRTRAAEPAVATAGSAQKEASASGSKEQPDSPSSWATFRRAALTCLLNPKAYLFMFAIFPQFLRAEYGPIWVQAVALAIITAATQVAVYGGLALAAGSAQGWIANRPTAAVWLARGAGVMLFAGAGATLAGVWRSAI